MSAWPALMRWVCAAAGAALLMATALEGQVVRGRVLERDSQQPVVGAIVSAVADSVRLWPVLTDSTGSFRLRAAAAGAYRLRVDRVGFRPHTADEPVVLSADAEVERTVLLPSARAELQTVRITADGSCRAPGIRGEDAARVWEQVRTALRAAVLSSEQALVPLEMSVKETMTPTAIGRFLRVAPTARPTATVRTTAARAFVSPPGFNFGANGFRVVIADSVEYFGPDAEVALSDGFVATHCFRVVRGGGLFGRGQRVGLAFAPLDSSRATFLRGTMWLDEASSRLDEMVYQYVVPVWPVDVPLPSGRIGFAPLRTGAWIVRDWALELPIMAIPPAKAAIVVGEGPRHIGTLEKRGRTRELRTARDSTTPPVILRGVVIDAVTDDPAQPLALTAWGVAAGATAPNGRFALQVRGVPREGAIIPLAVDDPLVRTYLGDSAERVLDVKPGETVTVQFTTPSADDLVNRWCPEALNPPRDDLRGTDQLGVLLAAVTRASGDTTALQVRAEWTWSNARNEPQVSTISAMPVGGGVYVVCPAAVDRRVLLVVSDASGVRYQRLLPQAPRRAWGVRLDMPSGDPPDLQ